ncbi:MAG: type IV secretory system conjugative DNA transfer family protein [Firmicutes bacterium]|nr:type IV secretory system conjugative DNA transfer family protein [Bacillota bacterium]
MIRSPSRGEWAALGAALAFDVLALPTLAAGLSFLLTGGTHGTYGLVPPWTGWALVATDAPLRQVYLVLAGAVVAGVGYLVWLARSGSAAPASGAAAYGSARWRTGRELCEGLGLWTSGAPRNPVGLVVGAEHGGRRVRRAWVVSRDGHTLVIGAPGAGKSTRLIEPTLAVIAAGGEGVLVNDPKGELYSACAGTFLLHGYDVVRFDLREPAHSVRWNPLLPVARALMAGDTAAATRHARQLAQIVTSQGAPTGGNDAFWRESTVALVTALALAVADQAPPEARNLASVHRLLTETADLDAFFAALPQGHPARLAYGAVRLSGGETRKSQLTVAAVAMGIFADPGVAWLTSGDELDPASLAGSKRAVFVVVPDDSSAYYPVAALFVAQVLQALAAEASRGPGGRLPSPVHLVLDEFGSLPRIPDFDKALAVARGRGVRIHLVLQAFSQLDSVYGPDVARTMRNSCNTWVYLSSNDVETARIVSEKTGQSTVATTTRGVNWQSAQQSRNETYAYTARPLLTPDEVARWPFGESLVLQAGLLPARLPLRPFEEWPWSGYAPPPARARRVAPPATWDPPQAPAGYGPEDGIAVDGI